MKHEANYPSGVLITGGARRIGRSLARSLAADGWRVAVHYNTSRAAAEELVEEITASGGAAVALQADLSQETEAQTLVARAAQLVGPLGVLINNASIFEDDNVATSDRRSWDAHMEPNLRAPLVLAQRFAEGLPEDRCGVVVNMIDGRVMNPTPGHLSYGVSKAALLWLTRTLAQELAPRVRVNAIGPGPTLPVRGQSDADFAERQAQLPLGTGPSLEEISAALSFLLKACSVTGQIIALDGGDHLGWSQPPEVLEGRHLQAKPKKAAE
jgi:NAD(P)-dependent dehydrogenase (short-subunit alcohol dehydrogenase family)